MTRNLKALGLALVAALAMSAMAASGASADGGFHFESSAAHTTLSGTQHDANVDVFTTDTGTVTCTSATYSGTVTGTAVTSIDVTPTYSGCTAFGVPATIHHNGCVYRFTTGTTTADVKHGTVDIVCDGAKDYIEVTAPGCRVTVTKQNNLAQVTYTNVANGDVTVDVDIKGITYEEHTQGIFPTCKNHTKDTTDGTYKGAGLVNGGAANISVVDT